MDHMAWPRLALLLALFIAAFVGIRRTQNLIVVGVLAVIGVGAAMVFIPGFWMAINDLIEFDYCKALYNRGPGWAEWAAWASCLEQRGAGPDAYLYPFVLTSLPFIAWAWRQERKEAR